MNVTASSSSRVAETSGGWRQAEEHIHSLYHATATNNSIQPRTVLLRGTSTDQASGALRQSLGALLAAQPQALVTVGCADARGSSFWPLRSLLAQLTPLLAREAPALLRQYAAELSAFYPPVKDALGDYQFLSLAQIAVTPSERRSHRESERAFRMINGLCAVLIAAQQQCPSLCDRPLVLWFDNLEAADRSTLLFFRRLSRWMNQAHAPLLLIGRIEADARPPIDDATLPPELERFFDWRAEHQLVLETVCGQSWGQDFRLLSEAGLPGVAVAALPEQAEQAGDDIRLALDSLHAGQIEEGCAYALQAMGSAVFALNYESVLLLGRQMLAALNDDRPFDQARFSAVWQRLLESDRYAALEFSVAGVEERRAILGAVWRAAAFAQTCLGQHELSVECYQHALSYAATPSAQGQIYMYLGLITGKRLHNVPQAEAYLREGLRLVDGLNDPETVLERGWLRNVSALMSFQTRHPRQALTFIQEARALMKPLHTSEATHLKVNLISNISVLLEMSQRLDEAISTWTSFRAFLRTSSELFAKHYFFREGGLNLQAGAPDAALESFEQSFTQSEHIGDAFHAEVAARACGYVCAQLQCPAEAAEWYARSVALREQIGDYEQLPESLLALALFSAQTDQLGRAQTLAARAMRFSDDLDLPWRTAAHEVATLLDQGTATALSEIVALVLKAPGSKLNRPFTLINTYQLGE